MQNSEWTFGNNVISPYAATRPRSPSLSCEKMILKKGGGLDLQNKVLVSGGGFSACQHFQSSPWRNVLPQPKVNPRWDGWVPARFFLAFRSQTLEFRGSVHTCVEVLEPLQCFSASMPGWKEKLTGQFTVHSGRQEQRET